MITSLNFVRNVARYRTEQGNGDNYLREEMMKAKLFSASVKAGRIDRNHVRIALAIGTLFLLAIGAGAPGENTGF